MKNKITIAADIFLPDIGGPATYSVKLAEFLLSAGFNVSLICYSDSRQEDHYTFKVSRIKRSKIKPWNYLKYFLVLLKLSFFSDIIYAQGPVNAGLPALLAAKILRKKLVVKVVGDYAWEQLRNSNLQELISIDQFQAKKFSGKIGWLQAIESLVCRGADIVITPSDYLNKLVVGWGVKSQRVKTVYNSFVRPKDLPLRDHSRQELGFGNDEFIVVSAGRPVPWKGFGLLHIAVSELVKQEKLPLKLRILGINPEDLSRFIKQESDVSSPIDEGFIKQEALGKQPKGVVYKYLMAANAFVLNTGYEGLSHVLLEAMSCGLPIITTNVCGNPELIEHGFNGLLIDYNNKDQLKENLALLYKDQDLRRKFVDNSYQVIAKFSFDRLKEDTIKIFNSLLLS